MTQNNKRRTPAPRQNRPAPALRRSRRGGAWSDVVKLAAGGAVVAVLALFLQTAWPDGFPVVPAATGNAGEAVEWITEIHTQGPVRLSEVMTGNRNSYVAEDGSTPDWIEVENVGDAEVDLAGYALAKSANAVNVFTFPAQKLSPGERVLVLADSRLRQDAGAALHAPFRLSAQGDTLLLFNPSGTAIDTVNIPALTPDTSYVRTGADAWQQSQMPTPGQPNTQAGYLALSEPSGDSTVIITELMSDNEAAFPDGQGRYFDYIEIQNCGQEAVNLEGWRLSDDSQQPGKWFFPPVELQPGECVLVFASGLNETDEGGQLHASFSLSAEGEQVVLYDAQGRVMDRIDFDLLGTDVAWSLTADGSWTAGAAPSPGQPNF